jgi:endonuclease/exonuclease/phosphatase family metal-dependent hydrolase
MSLSTRDDGLDGKRAALRVLTLNVWGHGGSWHERRRILQAGLSALQPDLIALQETIVRDGYDQVEELLGTDVHIAHQSGRHADGTGVSIVSRLPIAAVHEVDLHVTARCGDFPCTVLAVEVETAPPIGRVLFVNHFPSWQLDFEQERELQAVAAARFIDRLAGDSPMHVVVAGDLDADPDAASIRFWTGHQSLDGMSVCYRDAWASAHPGESGHTFTPANPLMAPAAPDWPYRRIDYILVRCGEHAGSSLQIDSCDLAFDAPREGVWASDHFGVFATLRAR